MSRFKIDTQWGFFFSRKKKEILLTHDEQMNDSLNDSDELLNPKT